ncbi:MAG TPA: aminoacyl-histidine dipeptidase [Clostridia bacterium]|nr:aminoacyl-histidine dipeptidase [Clostridia bacterium]
MEYRNIEPKDVFLWFYQINQIPRCSGNEKAISDYLVEFAKERKLEVYQDELLNVIIKKPATKGYEDSDTVIIQGHMDMVCIKGEDSNHDFTRDPIKMIVEGDILRADNTSLGGDNGIALAYGLAILDSNKLKHPPIELLITSNEETGMDGAYALTDEHLSGKILLNLDSEEEGVFLASCAGGANATSRFELKKEQKEGIGLEIVVSGLKGGHSGMEIIKQRGNAIKILARILHQCKEESDIRLSHIEGGTKHNAIPNEAKASILVHDKLAVENIIKDLAVEIKLEYLVEDSDLDIGVKGVNIQEVYTEDLSKGLIDYIMMVPDGVQYMSKDIEGLVLTSLNNAIIGEKESFLEIEASLRSSLASSLQEIANRLSIIGQRCGGGVVLGSQYPAWQYEENSRIRDLALKVYERLYSKKAKVTAIHAGLECGLLKEILPDTDMISLGPNMYDVHTEKEHLSISSVNRVWNFLVELLEELK